MSAARKTTKLDPSFYDRRRAELMKDPEFKAEYERQRRAIAAIDEIVNRLDALRVEHDLSKAELARAIDKNPASVRRLLTAKGNPELATVVAMADALDADVLVVPHRKRSRRGGAGA
jgi:nucleotide-binding universal stress UspA family protein